MQEIVEELRILWTDAGLWVPRKQRPRKIHQPRKRRSCPGDLIQIDGSDHRWFEEREPACSLLVFIDDAASRLMPLHFIATESPSVISRRRGSTSIRVGVCRGHHRVCQPA